MDEACWALLEHFHAGDMAGVSQYLSKIAAMETSDVYASISLDFEARFMDGFINPFGAIGADLAVSVWHLTKQSDKIQTLFDSISSADFESDGVDHYYPAQILKMIHGQTAVSDYFFTIDRLHPSLAQSLEASLECGTLLDVEFEDVFRRSEDHFLSYNGNIIFDLISLLHHLKASKRDIQAVAISAEKFRNEIISGDFKSINLEGKIGTLAFLLPIYPRIFTTAYLTGAVPEDAVTRLYFSVQNVTGPRVLP